MIASILELDRQLFVILNSGLLHPVLDTVMPFITEQEHWYPVLGGMWLALVIWGGRRGRTAAVALIIAVALADQITCSVLKPLFGRTRPCSGAMAEHCRLLVSRSRAFSFPSAHAANSFAMATVMSWLVRRNAWLFLLVAGAVAYSRVYVGVHYPLDVIGGAVLGVMLGRLAVWIVLRIRYRWERWREYRTSAEGVRRELGVD